MGRTLRPPVSFELGQSEKGTRDPRCTGSHMPLLLRACYGRSMACFVRVKAAVDAHSIQTQVVDVR